MGKTRRRGEEAEEEESFRGIQNFKLLARGRGNFTAPNPINCAYNTFTFIPPTSLSHLFSFHLLPNHFSISFSTHKRQSIFDLEPLAMGHDTSHKCHQAFPTRCNAEITNETTTQSDARKIQFHWVYKNKKSVYQGSYDLVSPTVQV